MTERFKAVIDNDYLDFSKEYYKVTIEANDLNVLNRVVGAIHFVERGEKE